MAVVPDAGTLAPIAGLMPAGSATIEAGESSLAERRQIHDLHAFAGTSAVLLISHDATRTGAPICLLEFAAVLKSDFECRLEIATCGDGGLLSELERLAPVTRLHGQDGGLRLSANGLLSQFRRSHADGLILVNTTAPVDVYRALDDLGIRDAVAWIHELPSTIDQYFGGPETIELIDRVTQRIVVPAEFCKDVISSRYRLPASKLVTVRNGVARSVLRACEETDRNAARQLVREMVGANAQATVILGCGTIEARKGVDLFAIVATEVRAVAIGHDVHFVWLGEVRDAQLGDEAVRIVAQSGNHGRLHFVGPSDNPGLYYAAADLFLITSRVDASPLVNAEAMLFGLPVVCFAGGGGALELHSPAARLAVHGFEPRAMALRVIELLEDDERRRRIGQIHCAHARSFTWSGFADRLAAFIETPSGASIAATDREASARHRQEQSDTWISEQLTFRTTTFEAATSLGHRARAIARAVSSYEQTLFRSDRGRPHFSQIPAVQSLRNDVIGSLGPADVVRSGQRILIILPDVEVGGGQINAIRLANALTATHLVFLLNARPRQYDESVSKLISPRVIPIEGSLNRLPWYDQSECWRSNSSNVDERVHRLRVGAELIAFYGIRIVLSQVWWSDRFALALRQLTEFRWFIKFCGCYELLMRNPGVDESFASKAAQIMRLVTGVAFGSDMNLAVFGSGQVPRPRAMRQILNGYSRDFLDARTVDTQLPVRTASDFVFCICSRAIKEKGWEEAIQAVALINQRDDKDRGGKRAKLWMIGDGPHLQDLKHRYAGREDVVFLGQWSHPDRIMRLADAGLLPSYFVGESVPTAVIEFLACDLPVIATGIGQLPKMLSCNGHTAGIVLPAREGLQGVDIEVLAGAMLQYMTDARTYRAHQAAARLIFDAEFDIGLTVRNYLSFFQEAQR